MQCKQCYYPSTLGGWVVSRLQDICVTCFKILKKFEKIINFNLHFFSCPPLVCLKTILKRNYQTKKKLNVVFTMNFVLVIAMKQLKTSFIYIFDKEK